MILSNFHQASAINSYHSTAMLQLYDNPEDLVLSSQSGDLSGNSDKEIIDKTVLLNQITDKIRLSSKITDKLSIIGVFIDKITDVQIYIHSTAEDIATLTGFLCRRRDSGLLTMT